MLMLESLAEEFLTHLAVERRLSPNTGRAYRHDIDTFLRFLEERAIPAEVDSVTSHLLREFLVWLGSRGLCTTTARRRFHALRSFWNYLTDWHDVTRNPFRRIVLPKPPRRPPVFLSPQEVQQLISAAEETRFVVRGLRDRAVLTLLVCTGLRRQELLDLQLHDIDLDEGLLRVRHGKGNRGRVIPVLPEASQALRDYLELRPHSQHAALFLTHFREPLGIKGIHDLFHRALRRSGINRPGITLHTLRHSFATLMLRGGCDLRSLQDLLGHRSLETTALYLHSDLGTLRRAVGHLSILSEHAER